MAKSWKDEKKAFGSPNQEVENVVLPLSLVGVLLNLLAGISTHFTAFLKILYDWFHLWTERVAITIF